MNQRDFYATIMQYKDFREERISVSTILIAGAGHGGLVAAMKLSQAGHRVTVYEARAEKELGYPQEDVFDPAAMEYAGLSVPANYRAPGNRLTFVPLEADVPCVTMPNKNEETLKVNRQEFLRRLVALCRLDGVEFCFECPITAPIVLGSRVAGFATTQGDVYGDLVIDACGVNSPLRSALPAFMQIENAPKEYDTLHTYRAYFKRVPGVMPPPNYYNVYVNHDGTEGFSWAVTEAEEVDVLIARFYPITYATVAEELLALSESNPHMGRELSRGGVFTEIPVRQPLGVMVADGYAAVGDSAFMTYSAKGSGIAYAIMAGAMLAQAAAKDELGLFTAETLWEYERTFYKEIGFDACRIAIVKNLLPYFTAQEANDLIKNGLITSEELAAFSSNAVSALIKSRIIPLLKEKSKVLEDMPETRAKLKNALLWLGKFTMTESALPNRYNREDVAKWAEKYNEFFDSIRYTPPVETLVTAE